MHPYRKMQNWLVNLVGKSLKANLKLLAAIVLLIPSCLNMEDPSIEVLADYHFDYTNITNIAVGGEYLHDSLFVDVTNRIKPFEVNNYSVEFEVLPGGGSVDNPKVLTHKDGKASTRWKLGAESFNQSATAKIYHPDGNFISEIRFNAYGMLYNSWNEVNFQPLATVSDAVSDTINQVSWLISHSKVYKRGVHFLDWQLINDTRLNGAREIEIDKNGVVYIGTWYGELYKTTDHGQSWIKCTNPIPDRPYFFYCWITNDGDLWATHYERGLWHSKDGGMTWLNPVKVSGTNFNMSGAFRLKNGWLLSLGSPTGLKSEIIKSEDDGKTWTSLPTPQYPYCFFVTANDEIIVCVQGMAVGIYKSTDLGQTYKPVHSVPVTFGTGSMQTYFHKFGSFYYMLVPGNGLLKTNNFEQFQSVLSEPNVGGLYIDHTGSLIVMGWHEKLNKSFFYGKK